MEEGRLWGPGMFRGFVAPCHSGFGASGNIGYETYPIIAGVPRTDASSRNPVRVNTASTQSMGILSDWAEAFLYQLLHLVAGG